MLKYRMNPNYKSFKVSVYSLRIDQLSQIDT